MSSKVNIRRLATGVPGLDNLLGGGLPEFSFNLIAGTPGSGKTTLVHQMMFSLATPDNRALFFTVLGEPALKMLRYQQQFPFFDTQKVSDSIRFVNLSADLLDGDFDRVLSRIAEEVKNYSPSFVFVDSFRSVVQSVKQQESGSTDLQRNSMVRKMQVVKMRGQAQARGLHTFRITDDGIQVFPRAIVQQDAAVKAAIKLSTADKRVSMGVPGLDEMLGGGLPLGYSLLVVGPSGSGKSILATEFLAEGVRRGEPGVIAAFEKSPSQLLSCKLDALVQDGKVGVINTRSLDLSIDETLHDLIEMINRMQAKRVVIDSLSGFELALAPEFREDFRGSLYRMVAELTAIGMTILMTSELEDRYTDLRFSPFGSAFLADAILVQRYIEVAGQFKRVLSVVKVRGSGHSKDIRLFDITDKNIVIGETLSGYSGIMSGRPTAIP